MTMVNRFLPLLLLAGSARAFAPPPSSLDRVLAPPSPGHLPSATTASTPSSSSVLVPRSRSSPSSSSSTALSERQWNFNQGRGPWGLKKNAEIWNGRLAQMAFVIVLLQEAITGKGVVASVQDGDAIGIAFLALAGVSTVGLTAWLAIKGDENDIKW
ncbi:hypothetical protein ACHAWF_006903 [Thalassiosira exigua]